MWHCLWLFSALNLSSGAALPQKCILAQNTFGFTPRGPLRNIAVHVWTKKQGEGGLFQPRMHKAGNTFRGPKCHVSGKGVVLLKFTHILQIQIYLEGQIWGKVPQNPCLGVNFAWWLKRASRGIFQNGWMFTHVYTCISEWPPLGFHTMTLKKKKNELITHHNNYL